MNNPATFIGLLRVWVVHDSAGTREVEFWGVHFSTHSQDAVGITENMTHKATTKPAGINQRAIHTERRGTDEGTKAKNGKKKKNQQTESTTRQDQQAANTIPTNKHGGTETIAAGAQPQRHTQELQDDRSEGNQPRREESCACHTQLLTTSKTGLPSQENGYTDHYVHCVTLL
jgi:hypothetical protein